MTMTALTNTSSEAEATLQTAPPANCRAAIQLLEIELNQAVIGHGLSIEALIHALLIRQHVLLLGVPGTAKTFLADQLAQRLNVPMFSYLLTKFTTPEEIFGNISLSALKNDRMKRITTGRLPESEICLLDEIFKASSAILNALLKAINERQFFDDGIWHQMPLQTMIGASNELPQGNELDALFDRFLFRVSVKYLDKSDFTRYLTAYSAPGSGQGVPCTSLSASVLNDARAEVASLPIPKTLIKSITMLRQVLADARIVPSDRRWLQCLNILRASAWLAEKAQPDEDDFSALIPALWATPEEMPKVREICLKVANPISAEISSINQTLQSVFSQAAEKLKNITDVSDKIKEGMAARKKLDAEMKRLTSLEGKARERNNPAELSKVQKVTANGQLMRRELDNLILGDSENTADTADTADGEHVAG